MKYLFRALKLLLPLKRLLALYLLCVLVLGAVSSAPLGLANVLLYNLNQPSEAPATTSPEGERAVERLKPGGDTISEWVNARFTSWLGTGWPLVRALCFLMLLCLVIKAGLDFATNYLQGYISTRLQMDATVRVMRHALSLDLAYFDTHRAADIGTRIYGDTNALRATAKVTLDMLEKPPQILFYAAVAVAMNAKLFLVSAVAIPLIAVAFFSLTRKLYKNARKAIGSAIDMAHAGGQVLGGMRMVRAYNAIEAESDNFARLAAKFTRYVLKKVALRAIQRPLTEVVMGLGGVAVLAFGSHLVLNNQMALGDFIVFFFAVAALTGPLRGFMNTLGDIAEMVPSAERTFELLDVKPSIVDKPGAVAVPPLQREIAFESVTLDYGRGPIFEKLDLTIRKGERIGIVGRTGVGKSSLISILLRFYEPKEGTIRVDGVDIRDATLHSLRAQMALVSPETHLFHTTIEDNIRYGKPGARDEEVVAAAQAAAVHDEIVRFPEGYKTVVGPGGTTLSAGQRQRVAVARAILRDAPVLLLDEATSQMDTASEAKIQAALDMLAKGRTSLVIAHRLSTIRDADRIVVFRDEGGIEAVGPHDELMESSPTYRRLWERVRDRGSGDGKIAAA